MTGPFLFVPILISRPNMNNCFRIPSVGLLEWAIVSLLETAAYFRKNCFEPWSVFCLEENTASVWLIKEVSGDRLDSVWYQRMERFCRDKFARSAQAFLAPKSSYAQNGRIFHFFKIRMTMYCIPRPGEGGPNESSGNDAPSWRQRYEGGVRSMKIKRKHKIMQFEI